MEHPLTQVQMDRIRALCDRSGPLAGSKPYWDMLEDIESAEELFYLPWLLNWDARATWKTVKWIIDHPLCDAGVGLAIFWLHQPQDWEWRKDLVQTDAWFIEHITFHQRIEERYLAGTFPSMRLSYDPRMDWKGVGTGQESEKIALIPQAMKLPSPGFAIKSPRNLRW